MTRMNTNILKCNMKTFDFTDTYTQMDVHTHKYTVTLTHSPPYVLHHQAHYAVSMATVLMADIAIQARTHTQFS